MSASKQASGAGSPVAGGRYLQDFAVGQTYGPSRGPVFPSKAVSRHSIIAWASNGLLRTQSAPAVSART